MAYRPRVAVIDACVLYPFHLRNLLIQCAVDRLIDARWSDAIHEEWIANLLERDPTLSRSRLERTKALMNAALPDADVSGYQRFMPSIELPDADDRHVAAVGIASGSSLIVTWNLRDFPDERLAPHGLRAQSPDAVLTELHDAMPGLVVESVARARRNLSRSMTAADGFLATLERQGLIAFTKALRPHASDL